MIDQKFSEDKLSIGAIARGVCSPRGGLHCPIKKKLGEEGRVYGFRSVERVERRDAPEPCVRRFLKLNGKKEGEGQGSMGFEFNFRKSQHGGGRTQDRFKAKTKGSLRAQGIHK